VTVYLSESVVLCDIGRRREPGWFEARALREDLGETVYARLVEREIIVEIP